AVSIAIPGPTSPFHQPGVGWRESTGPTTCESPVRACSTRTTLDRSSATRPHRCTASVTPGRTTPVTRVRSPSATWPRVPSPGGSSASGSEGRAMGALAGGRREAELEVGDDVLDRLDAHGEADARHGDSRAGVGLRRALRVRRGGRVAHQRADVADVDEAGVQLECVDERPGPVPERLVGGTLGGGEVE